MANVLREWHLLSLTEDTLEIARGNNSFSSSYLDEQERLNKFVGYCRDFFKRDLKIKIVDNRGNNNEKINFPREEKLHSTGKKYSDLPRPVQDILQVFQGEIKKEVLVEKKGTGNSGKAEIIRR
jgi:hypothetical protein